jgi:transcriptional regulator with XRE-family HTH domain
MVIGFPEQHVRPGSPFGDMLRAFRIRKGIGLRKFAVSIEMQPSNYSAIECGRRSPPSDERIQIIALALGLSREEYESLKSASSPELTRLRRQVELLRAEHAAQLAWYEYMDALGGDETIRDELLEAIREAHAYNREFGSENEPHRD